MAPNIVHGNKLTNFLKLRTEKKEMKAITIDLPVDVLDYTNERVEAFDAHHTQFPKRARVAYNVLVHARKTEDFIIARNRKADILLQKCFRYLILFLKWLD